jgi:sporulation protein YlmC with PRC-barrel domain
MMLRIVGVGVALSLAGPLSAQITEPDYPSYKPGPEVRNGYTAEDLRDAEVRGKDGKTLGEIEDLVIGPDGQLRRLIVDVNEGFLGIGGRRLAIDWSDVKVGPREDGDPQYVTAPVTKQNVEEFGLFKDRKKAVKGGPREWRATELLGDYISLKDVDQYGSVTDLMFDKSGKLRAIAASPDFRGSIVRFYAPYSGIDKGWDPGDEYFVLPYSEGELKDVLPKAMTQRSAQDD